MERSDFETLHSLLEEIKASLATYEATRSNPARNQALEQALKLTRALESPKDAVFKLFLSPTQAMAVKVAHDLGIFSILTGSETAISCQDLADRSGAHPLLVERIMRVIVAMDFASEQGPEQYRATRLSKEITGKKSGIVDTLFLDLAPAILQTPAFLRDTHYQNPEDHSAGPIQYTYHTPMNSFEWLATDKAAHARFHAYVEGVREGQPDWVDWFPVQARILDGCVASASDPLIVNVAAGSGRDMLAFRRKFPDVAGRIIIQDLPAVFQDVHGQDLGLEKIEHDVFEPQPVVGARVYYLRFILHEFSDDNCRKILANITRVMTRGYSKVLIEEFLLPDEHAGLLHSMVDMILMVFGPGIVRTQTRWVALLESVGLSVNLVAHPDADGPSIIEAELANVESE
ncbi:S-adenosyl-L-methionine-dependent methyltransferase [Aspergillus aculeatinus CBS 121060]|uniref:S-adenosyl-L-methionine-dependent methyltransferase n=1 Tax=Aspergillus aculeatinus CBS 121060 TaxID=1448322 RepID=A0ACD1H9D9_9EURO|nr:S-adenosyl-L-methionine-dependent methyltransferase [Aspergillus aculeatinus CBS 121060]RAH70000.1 S-adenosyl-L-methionine-dependent methyltransferase [Aspergillus aculeatinus CBS 121060]